MLFQQFYFYNVVLKLVVHLREVQISVCQIVPEIAVEAEQESVNKLLKKEQIDCSNISIDTQPEVHQLFFVSS